MLLLAEQKHVLQSGVSDCLLLPLGEQAEP